MFFKSSSLTPPISYNIKKFANNNTFQSYLGSSANICKYILQIMSTPKDTNNFYNFHKIIWRYKLHILEIIHVITWSAINK